ncbi:hypothetical protein NQD34_018415 [Periophthalmus magnuspinnatus]|nr:hypothetical protein NQD34_018415 [Periophthalmus magnuspinnatus]
MLVKKTKNLYKMFIKLKLKMLSKDIRYKNKLTDIIRTGKLFKYYKRILYENKNNIKRTWDILNSVIKQGSTKPVYPSYFEDINGVNHNIKNIVSSFNNFFVNIGPELFNPS